MVLKLYVCCTVHALLGISSLYYTSVLNPMEHTINNFLNSSLQRYPTLSNRPSSLSWIWALLNTAVTIGWVGGGLLLKVLTELWTRKTVCCLIQPITLILACLMMSLSGNFNSFELLIAGHLVTGLSMSLFNLTSVFAVECSPIDHRPTIAALFGLGIPVWCSIGAILGLPQLLGNDEYWQWALALPIIPSLIYIFIGLFFMHQSPRELYIVQGDAKRSADALRFYHGNEVDVKAVLFEMERERESDHNTGHTTLRHILGSKHLRWPFLLCIAVGLSTTVGGGSFISRSYSTQILHMNYGMAKEQAATLSVFIVLVPSALASLVGIAVARFVRRRVFLLGSLLIADTGLVLVLLAGYLDSAGLAVCGFALSVWMYLAVMLPLAAALPAEICAQKTRAYGLTAVMLAEGLLGTAQAQLYPPLSRSMGIWAYAPLCALDIPIVFLLLLYLPETKGVTNDQVLSQMDEPKWKYEEEKLMKM